ncbi:hypothetical protein ACSNOI_31880 [Actinomadura kijaniata]|uniref:hypothetical protein n=1 Tax=Actinomadura kijaniata TaxID=46161 RepID=UPI003F1DE653
MDVPADNERVGKVGGTIGQVTAERYEQLVAKARELVESMSQAQFVLGDLALEIEPMNPAHTGGTKDTQWGSSGRCGSSPMTSAWPPRR